MIKQKVITVNINPLTGRDSYKEIELKEVNKYLEEGYIVFDKFSTVPNGNTSCINLTFILQEGKMDAQSKPRIPTKGR